MLNMRCVWVYLWINSAVNPESPEVQQKDRDLNLGISDT